MKQFFSHAGNFKGREIKPKLLRDHTSGVTQKALVQLSPQAFGRELSHFFKQIGLYHDLGKYTPHFQNYLLKSGYFNPRLKRHAMFGAFVLCCKFLQNGGERGKEKRKKHMFVDENQRELGEKRSFLRVGKLFVEKGCFIRHFLFILIRQIFQIRLLMEKKLDGF